MSEYAEPAQGAPAPLVRPPLDRVAWQPPRGESMSRREVVDAVVDWMPYPFESELLAIDLAVAALESGDEAAALHQLNSPEVRDALVSVVKDVLGTGDLADRRSYGRAVTFLGLHRQDLVALSRLAQHLGPQLERLFYEFDQSERLVTRARSAGLQTLLSSDLARGAASGLMGEERPVTHIDAAPIDLAVVPPRVFAWEGPEHNELRLIRTEGDGTVEVRIEAAVVDVARGAYYAFVTLGDLTVEAPLVRTQTGALRATITFGTTPLVEAGSPVRFGIRHATVSHDWALSRLASGEVEVTRTVVDTWARLRLWHASLAVEHFGAETPPSRWTTPSLRLAATVTRDVLQARRKELLIWPMGLIAGGEDLKERNAAAKEGTEAFLRDALQWGIRPEIEGPRRPLICETRFVLPREAPAALGERRS